MRAHLLLALACIACGNDRAPGGVCAVEGQIGESPIRRLTPLQYQNTVRDLFGDPSIAVSLHADVDIIPSAIAVEKLADAATELGPRGVALAAELPGCAKDDACAASFIDTFATRAFRRPLLADEREWLLATYTAARAQFTFDESITILTQVILQAPQFLYLSNDGVALPKSPGMRRLDDYALASRLSYFLWNSLPDDELLAAAAAGKLSTDDRDGLREQAERMMGSPRAREMAHELVTKWFQLDGGTVHFGIMEAPKSTELYPDLDEGLRTAMLRETGALMEKVAFDGGSISDLFTDTSAYVNGPLAKLYGIADGPTSESDWAWVKLDPKQRSGILTRAAFATVYSSSKVQSPIRRGVFVLRRILCYNQPPPPPDVDNRPIEDLENTGGPKTIREATLIRTQGELCQGCHSIIDPIGFAFEHYDAIGAYRDEEIMSQLPIDSSAVLSKSGNVDGPVADAIEMSAALGQSEAAASCLIKQWFEHAIRRDPALADRCSFVAVKRAMHQSNSVRDLLLAIVTSDAFIYANTGAEP